MMLLICEVRTNRKLLEILCANIQSIEGKSPEQYYLDSVRQQRELILSDLADHDPEKASWLSRYIRERMREDSR